MNFYGAVTDHVEHEIGLNDKNAISISRKIFMFGHPPEVRIGSKSVDSLVELFREGGGPCGTVPGDPVINREQVVLGNREVTDHVLIRHGCASAVSASSANE